MIPKFDRIARTYFLTFLGLNRPIYQDSTGGNSRPGLATAISHSLEFQYFVQLDRFSGYFNYAKADRNRWVLSIWRCIHFSKGRTVRRSRMLTPRVVLYLQILEVTSMQSLYIPIRK